MRVFKSDPDKSDRIHTRLAWLALFLFATSTCAMFVGCDQVAKPIGLLTLEVSPQQLLIELPSLESIEAGAVVTLTNPGRFEVVVSRVEITESDDVTELEISNLELWSEPVSIPPGESRMINVLWRLQDTVADEAILTVETEADTYTVALQTGEVSPGIELVSDPPATSSQQGVDIRLAEVMPGVWQRVELSVRSLSLAVLSLQQICFINEAGQCINTSSSRAFRLCDGRGATPESCSNIETLTPLERGESYAFSVLFELPAEELRSMSERFVIYSDAVNAPELVVQIIAPLCIRDNDGACMPVYYIEGASFSMGSTIMSTDSYQLEGSLENASHLSFDAKNEIYILGKLTP